MGRGIRPRPKHIGKKLKIIRSHLGLTQEQMCERLGYRTITPPQISEYESGKREPPYPVTLKIARMAGVSTDILIDDKLELERALLAEAGLLRKTDKELQEDKEKNVISS